MLSGAFPCLLQCRLQMVRLGESNCDLHKVYCLRFTKLMPSLQLKPYEVHDWRIGSTDCFKLGMCLLGRDPTDHPTRLAMCEMEIKWTDTEKQTAEEDYENMHKKLENVYSLLTGPNELGSLTKRWAT